MESLLTIQFLGLLSTALAAGVCFHRCKQDEKQDELVWRIIVTVLYELIDFSCFMVLVSYLHTSQASWNAIQELSTACQPYKTITPAFVYSKIPLLFNIRGKELFSRKDAKARGFIFGISIAGPIAIGLVAFIARLVAKIQHKNWLLGAMSLAFSIAGLALLGEMERKRDVMRSITREKFQDDEWGFGQVIALCLWVPFIIQLLFKGFQVGKCNRGHRPSNPTPDHSDISFFRREVTTTKNHSLQGA